MQFNKNKTAFVHQWYPFVEGYSKEFIQSIISELDYKPQLALDPFGGSGTTPVELQSLNIACYSFEVSPFMHLLASVKLESNYNSKEFEDALITVGESLQRYKKNVRDFVSPPIAKTIVANKKLDKWIFNESVMDGILDIKYAIKQLSDIKYRDLFYIVLASILLDVSNVYRDGKSLKYKENWKTKRPRRQSIHKKFLDRLIDVIQHDIEIIDQLEKGVNNKERCILGDVRQKIDTLPDNSIDLVITSPPYLNSRDYTDIYIAELWVLDLVKDYEELRNLRKSTLRSHVQVKHGELKLLNNEQLNSCIQKIGTSDTLWNIEIPNMIKAYFLDMDTLFQKLKQKMVRNKKVFFNVANSAYYSVEIKVDEIVASIATTHGFKVEEIREARRLKPSSQQKDTIKSLRESVIVMTS